MSADHAANLIIIAPAAAAASAARQAIDAANADPSLPRPAGVVLLRADATATLPAGMPRRPPQRAR